MGTKKAFAVVAGITLLAGAVNVWAADTRGQAGRMGMAEQSDTAFEQFLARGRSPRQTITTNQFTAKNANCAASATTCAFGATGFVLGCGAAVYASFGALGPECLAAWAGVGGVCATAAYYCGGGTGTPPTRRLTTVGDFTDDGTGPDYFVERTCAYPRFVDQIKVEWFYVSPGVNLNARVSRVTLRCNANANGATSNLVFGHAGGTNSNTYTCSAGRLQAGFLIRAGAELDAMGGVCRAVSTSNLTTYVNGIWGGDGGTRQDRVCASGTNLVGAKFNMDGANESSANLLGVQPICR